MRSLLLIVLLGLSSLPATVHAAAYATGFNMPPYSASTDLAGQDGWLINDPINHPDHHSSFFINLNGSITGALGGYYNPPASTKVDLAHAYGGSLNGTAFTVDFVLIASTAIAPGADSFGYSFNDDADNTLFRVAFEPSPVQPLKEPGLEIVYYDSSNTRKSTQIDLFYNAIYKLAISFGTSGVDGTFNAQVSAGVGAPLIWAGTLVGAGAAMLATFGVDWDVKGATGADSGDNYMIFDNISVGPPPSPPPPTLNITLNSSRQPVVGFQGTAGTMYRLLRSTSLVSSSWSAQQTLTAPANGSVEFIDPTPPIGSAFYRVDIAPPVLIP